MANRMGVVEALGFMVRTQWALFRLRRTIARLERERRRASMDYEDFNAMGMTNQATESLIRFSNLGLALRKAYNRLNDMTTEVPPEYRA